MDVTGWHNDAPAGALPAPHLATLHAAVEQAQPVLSGAMGTFR